MKMNKPFTHESLLEVVSPKFGNSVYVASLVFNVLSQQCDSRAIIEARFHPESNKIELRFEDNSFASYQRIGESGAYVWEHVVEYRSRDGDLLHSEITLTPAREHVNVVAPKEVVEAPVALAPESEVVEAVVEAVVEEVKEEKAVESVEEVLEEKEEVVEETKAEEVVEKVEEDTKTEDVTEKKTVVKKPAAKKATKK